MSPEILTRPSEDEHNEVKEVKVSVSDLLRTVSAADQGLFRFAAKSGARLIEHPSDTQACGEHQQPVAD